MSKVKTPADVEAWLRRMDQVGMEVSVVQTTATGDEFDRQADLFFKPHPDRFQVYCGLEVTGMEAADYPARAVREGMAAMAGDRNSWITGPPPS